MAEIIYPKNNDKDVNHKGYLLYTRPVLYGTESSEIGLYAASNPAFPHQTTGDQFYDEKQFEAYRALGFCTMEEILGDEQSKNLSEIMKSLCDKYNNPY